MADDKSDPGEFSIGRGRDKGANANSFEKHGASRTPPGQGETAQAEFDLGGASQRHSESGMPERLRRKYYVAEAGTRDEANAYADPRGEYLAFKVSAAPFHMWTPDVYEGSPTPVTAFFATAPKVAAMALIARLVQNAFGTIPGDWGQVLAALAVFSMFLGAIAAIGQRDIKRLMAYSSIAHMGFALVGLAAGTAGGVKAMLIYMVIYVTMNIGTFAFILSMEKDGRPITTIDSLNMYSRRDPLKALAMLVLLFSLAGVPPMVGFFGKFYVLQAAVDAGMTWLALAGAVASVIGAFYYLRIVFYMYFGKEGDVIDTPMVPAQWLALVGVAAIMVLGIINLFGIEPLAAMAAETLVSP